MRIKKKRDHYVDKLYIGWLEQYNSSGKYDKKIEKVRVSPTSDQHKDVCKNANWKCKICGLEYIKNPLSFEIHHIDGNRENPKTNNLALLCANHHSEIHGLARVKIDNYKKTYKGGEHPKEPEPDSRRKFIDEFMK